MGQHVGKLVRIHRERTGWKQIDVAYAIEYDQGMLSKVEAGRLPAPAQMRYRLAEELGISDEQMKVCQILDDTKIDISKSASRQHARLWLAFIASQNMVELDPEETDELLDLFMGREEKP